MTARIHLFTNASPPAETPADRRRFIAEAQRAYLAVEDALAGQWSDSVLISCLVTAGPDERGAIIRELEARGATPFLPSMPISHEE